MERASIILVRHGATQWNTEDRFLSRTDLSLNQVGTQQAFSLREEFATKDVGSVFVSPLVRAFQTGEIAFPRAVRTTVEALREIDFGGWEGLTGAEVRSQFPSLWKERTSKPVTFRPPGGESFEDVARRLRPFIQHLKEETGRVAIVSHRGTLAVLERLLRSRDLSDRQITGIQPGEYRELGAR